MDELTCTTCGKESKSKAGMAAHMRSHGDEQEVASEELVEARNGFWLYRIGSESGLLKDADGKPVSKVMPFDKALRAFDRFSTRK